MISTDDPRLTAYASGDLPAEDAARFEAELAADPAARVQLDALRALQRELAAAFAAEKEDAEQETEPNVMPFAQPTASASDSARGWRLPAWLGPLAAAACVVLMAGAILVPTVGKVRDACQRPAAASNLRQIGQASLIYASENKDQLPNANATDVWDYAAKLAQGGGLNDATIWSVMTDPAYAHSLSVVLRQDLKTYDSDFRESKPSYAVAFGKIDTSSPATTPIAWTRGLQPDGTWAAHAPYGTDGGYIVFLGGNVQFYRNLTGELIGTDGNRTSNILEALPPGTRIGEYVPNESEQREWAAANRMQKIQAKVLPMIIPALWLLGLLILIVQKFRGKCSGWRLAWYIIIGLLVAMIIPSVS